MLNIGKDIFLCFRSYEHVISMHLSLEDVDRNAFLDEYNYFIDNGKIGALDFYRKELMIQFMKNDKYNVNDELFNFLQNSVGTIEKGEVSHINNTNLIKKLNKRRGVTYRYYASHQNEKTPLSENMLQVYTKAYENEEMLYLWKYFVDLIAKAKFDRSLRGFRYRKDINKNILKGKLIENISRNLASFPNVKKIFDTAYSSDFRNDIDHNNVIIDENQQCIKRIDDDSIIMNKSEFTKVLFFIQSLHNQTMHFLETQLEDQCILLNEGIISSITTMHCNEYMTLHFLQLEPFYVRDNKENQQLKTIELIVEGNYLVFFSNRKEIIRVKIDITLLLWYLGAHKNSIRVFSYSNFDNSINADLSNIMNEEGYYINEIIRKF